jgi:hypothetical protein
LIVVGKASPGAWPEIRPKPLLAENDFRFYWFGAPVSHCNQRPRELSSQRCVAWDHGLCDGKVVEKAIHFAGPVNGYPQ